MRARYVNEMTEGSHVSGTFLMSSKEVRVARNGDAYLSLRLADRSGEIGCVYFRPSSLSCAIPVGAVVAVEGQVGSYRGRRMMTLTMMAPADSWDPSDLAQSSPRPEQELQSEMSDLVRSIHAQDMRRLLRVIYRDKEVFSRLSACPATVGEHHCYLHGLLEHTVATARTCRTLAAQYPDADSDLLVTAALLHDIGRIDEIEWDAGITWSADGRLVGHVLLGIQRVQAAATKANVRQDRMARLVHAIAAHHADHSLTCDAYTFEAMLLQHADRVDAEIADFRHASASASRADERWTSEANRLGHAVAVTRAVAESTAHTPDAVPTLMSA